MSKKIITMRCWKCRKTFTEQVGEKDVDLKKHVVMKMVKCPSCGTPCILDISEHHAGSVGIIRHITGLDDLNKSIQGIQTDREADIMIFDTSSPKDLK